MIEASWIMRGRDGDVTGRDRLTCDLDAVVGAQGDLALQGT